jgi:hypothetical protein
VVRLRWRRRAGQNCPARKNPLLRHQSQTLAIQAKKGRHHALFALLKLSTGFTLFPITKTGSKEEISNSAQSISFQKRQEYSLGRSSQVYFQVLKLPAKQNCKSEEETNCHVQPSLFRIPFLPCQKGGEAMGMHALPAIQFKKRKTSSFGLSKLRIHFAP